MTTVKQVAACAQLHGLLSVAAECNEPISGTVDAFVSLMLEAVDERTADRAMRTGQELAAKYGFKEHQDSPQAQHRRSLGLAPEGPVVARTPHGNGGQDLHLSETAREALGLPKSAPDRVTLYWGPSQHARSRYALTTSRGTHPDISAVDYVRVDGWEEAMEGWRRASADASSLAARIAELESQAAALADAASLLTTDHATLLAIVKDECGMGDGDTDVVDSVACSDAVLKAIKPFEDIVNRLAKEKKS